MYISTIYTILYIFWIVLGTFQCLYSVLGSSYGLPKTLYVEHTETYRNLLNTQYTVYLRAIDNPHPDRVGETGYAKGFAVWAEVRGAARREERLRSKIIPSNVKDVLSTR